MSNGKSSRFAAALDWLQRGQVLWALLVALGIGKLVDALLRTFTSIPEIWRTPIWLLGAALVLLAVVKLLGRVAGKSAAQKQTSIVQDAATSGISTPQFNPERFFQLGYNSSLQEETEKNFRSVLARYKTAEERENFCVKLMAMGLIGYSYDIIWAYIYRSQLLLLYELTHRYVGLEEAKQKYYGDAATKFPVIYANYPFEKWVDFLKNHVLILFHPGDVMEITVRGKDFLKYAVHYGYSADTKSL